MTVVEEIPGCFLRQTAVCRLKYTAAIVVFLYTSRDYLSHSTSKLCCTQKIFGRSYRVRLVSYRTPNRFITESGIRLLLKLVVWECFAKQQRSYPTSTSHQFIKFCYLFLCYLTWNFLLQTSKLHHWCCKSRCTVNN